MTAVEAAKSIKELSEKVDYHNHLYYQKSKTEISDVEFDQLLQRLINLENQFPELKFPDSPTQRVGGTITKEFENIAHQYRQESCRRRHS